MKVARLTDIQDVTVSIGKQVHACGFLSDNREATESSIAVLVELSVSSVLLLRVELYRAALFVSLRMKLKRYPRSTISSCAFGQIAVFRVTQNLDVRPRFASLTDYVRRIERDFENAEIAHVAYNLQRA